MFTMLVTTACQHQGHVFGGMSSRGHAAPIEYRGVIEQGAAVDRVFLRLEQVDQVGHHGYLKPFYLLQCGYGFIALTVV